MVWDDSNLKITHDKVNCSVKVLLGIVETIVKPKFDHRSRIFELDACDGYSKVCLVYRGTKLGLMFHMMCILPYFCCLLIPDLPWFITIPFKDRTLPASLQGGPAKVRPTYIFDGNISMHS